MRFFDAYKPQWIDDSVVKFGYDTMIPKDKMDELEVLNNSNQPTGYLLINAKERFLILDLQPKEKVKFSIFPQSWLSWISCKGNFENNQVKFYRGVNFSLHDNAETHIPKHYFITIKDDEVLVQSSEIDGYTDQNGVEIKIPKYQESQ